MKILFLGGGRRVELAKRFIERGYDLIFSYELNEHVPISEYATIVKGLKWTDTNILDDIIGFINTWKTGFLIIPLQDEAVTVASDLYTHWLQHSINDSIVLASSYNTAFTCFNKARFENFMLNRFPRFYPFRNLDELPAIIKPMYGFGSKNLVKVWKKDDWPSDYKDAVVQRLIIGKEYSVDAYFTPYSDMEDAVVRERLRIGSGEVITTKTVYMPNLHSITKEVGETLGLVGPTNTQFIVEESTQLPYIIEINARFGGGWTLSMEAGLDAISLIERDYLGKDFEYHRGKTKIGLVLDRSYRDYFYKD